MELNKIFSDHMVFQANKPITVFGIGKGNVTIKLLDFSVTEFFDTPEWYVELPALDYGGPYELTVILNGEEINIKDVYIGEVILLAGQSNIAMSLGASSYKKEKYEENQLVRLFTSESFGMQGNFNPSDGWIKCAKDTAEHFSAIGYHIGIELCRNKGIAVGLVACYLGSSVIESWLPASIANEERFKLPKEEKYDSPYVHVPHNEYGTLYNVKQQSVVPYTLGNIVWYQGESNTGSGEWKVYTELLAELINCWRKDFMDQALPFTVVQIADWDERNDNGWKGIQKAQERIVDKVSNVKLVKSADVCETNDIHPPTKLYLAKRIYDSLYI